MIHQSSPCFRTRVNDYHFHLHVHLLLWDFLFQKGLHIQRVNISRFKISAALLCSMLSGRCSVYSTKFSILIFFKSKFPASNATDRHNLCLCLWLRDIWSPLTILTLFLVYQKIFGKCFRCPFAITQIPSTIQRKKSLWIGAKSWSRHRNSIRTPAQSIS